MAIEIIPKSRIKKTPPINILLYALALMFLVFLVSYFVLYFSQEKQAREISDTEKALQKSPSEKNLEDGILGYQRKLEDIGLLLSNHMFTPNLFNNLEKNIHPRVWFSRFRLDLTAGTIDVTGTTDNSEVLGQQTLIFEKQEFIKNINLSKVLIGKDGKINFELRLTFDQKIFTPLEILQLGE